MAKASTEFDIPAEIGQEILRVEVGSTLHGTGLPGGEDLDLMSIWLERPESTLGLASMDHYMKRTQPEGQRSGPGDIDLASYSARRWASLALSGNPTILLVLYAPRTHVFVESEAGRVLRQNPEWFWSSRGGEAFLGYMNQQRMRLTGDRGRAGRVRTRGPCTACGGVGCEVCVGTGMEPDWKYAMHLLRLGIQGIEFLRTGRITLPVPAEHGEHLRAVRRGERSMVDVIAEAESLEQTLRSVMARNTAPRQPNVQAVQRWLIDAHLDCWRSAGMLDLATR